MFQTLSKDGIEVTRAPAPRIVLAEATQEAAPPLELGPSRELGPFHAFDLVLYQRRTPITEPAYSPLSFASLEQ